MESGEQVHLKKANITLNDCLACSGCITSAESILIAEQSHLQLEKYFLFCFSKNKNEI